MNKCKIKKIESDNEKLHLSDANITKIKNLFEELIRENVRYVAGNKLEFKKQI